MGRGACPGLLILGVGSVSLFLSPLWEALSMVLYLWLPLPTPVSLPLFPSPSLSTPSSSLPQEEAWEGLLLPSASPTPSLPRFFFPPLAPYSRQIKCTQLLPAETGLNCTPVAMAIPDDLRGWNVALQISVLGPPGSTDFLAWEVTHRA